MLIVTQDRTSIINLDNAFMLKVNRGRNKEAPFRVTAYDTADGCIDLGEYATEDVAKKVLREIAMDKQGDYWMPSSKEGLG